MWFDCAVCLCKYLVCRSRTKLGLTGDGALSSFSRYSVPSQQWPALSLSLSQARYVKIVWVRSPPQAIHSKLALSSLTTAKTENSDNQPANLPIYYTFFFYFDPFSYIHVSLYIINSKKPVRGTVTGLDQRCLMFMSHIGHSIAYRTDWNYRDGWIVIN